MSWRVNYQPVMADMEADLLDPAHPAESPVRMPVMPGGYVGVRRVARGAWHVARGAWRTAC